MGGRANKPLIIISLFVVVVSLLSAFFIFKSLPIERHKIGVKFTVGEPPGFDLNSSEIVFGRVPPGGGSLRKIIIGNQHNMTVVVRAYASQDIASFVRINSSVVLSPYNSTILSVSLAVPESAPWGDYKGYITFETRRK